ncbi:DUF1120 domain-containing protein [Klebsiella aerogenes]
MMKKSFRALTGFACILIACIAMAAGTADMSVGGTILTGSCTPTLDKDIFDLGVIGTPELKNSSNQLTPLFGTLSINCTTPLVVAWNVVDNRHNTIPSSLTVLSTLTQSDVSDPSYISGLGVTAEGQKIGGYIITMTDHVVSDGMESDGVMNIDDPTDINGYVYIKGSRLSVDGKGGDSVSKFGVTPSAFMSASYLFVINTAVVSASTLNLSDDTIVDGSTTINLVYL